MTNVSSTCNLCGTPKHPLFMCRKLKSLPCEQCINIVKEGEMCFNCFKQGHFKQQYLLGQKWQKCGKAHHTLLHQHSVSNPRVSASSSNSGDQGGSHSLATTKSPSTHLSHLSHPKVPSQSQFIFMMCRVMVTIPEGYEAQATALLDSASSSSFITEQLTQILCLPRQCHYVQIAGIGGTPIGPSSHSVVSFNVTSMCPPKSNRYRNSQWEVEAIVLLRIRAKLPTSPVKCDKNLKHLAKLNLVDPDLGIPGHIGIILGINIFYKVICQGRWTGFPVTPSAIQTSFGWVLSTT